MSFSEDSSLADRVAMVASWLLVLLLWSSEESSESSVLSLISAVLLSGVWWTDLVWSDIAVLIRWPKMKGCQHSTLINLRLSRMNNLCLS